MDILKLIEKAHKTVEGLFDKMQESFDNKSKREDLLAQIKEELLLHNKLEESLLYEELQNRGEEVLAIRSHEKHDLAEEYIKSLETNPSDAQFAAKAEALKTLVMTHIDEEDDEVFDAIKEEFSQEELTNLGQKFIEEKSRKRGITSIKSTSTFLFVFSVVF